MADISSLLNKDGEQVFTEPTGSNKEYDAIHDVVQFFAENYDDPDDLMGVALCTLENIIECAQGLGRQVSHVEAPKDYWAEDVDYPVRDWQHEVAEDNTRQGYWDWVHSQHAANEEDDGEEGEEEKET